jgi:hypothetical protein
VPVLLLFFYFVEVLIHPQMPQAIEGRGFGKICIVMEAAGILIYAP